MDSGIRRGKGEVMGMKRWCEWQHCCQEDIGNDTWTCTAHLQDSRALQCHYTSMKDAKERTYPCINAEPVEAAEAKEGE